MQDPKTKNRMPLNRPSANTTLTPQMKSASLLKNSSANLNMKLKSKKTITTHSGNYNGRNQKQAANNLKKPIYRASSSIATGNPNRNTLDSSTPYPVSPVPQHQPPTKYWRGGQGGNHMSTTIINNHNHNPNPYRNKKNGSAGANSNNNNHHSYQYHHNNHNPHGKTHNGNKTFVKNTGNVGKSKPSNNHHNHHHNRFRYKDKINIRHQNIAKDFNQQENREKESPTWLRDEKVDKMLTDELKSSLETHGVFEDRDGSQKRLMVLSYLKRLITEWSDENVVSITGQNTSLDERCHHQNVNEETHRQKHCYGIKAPQLISFGSYRLGVHNPTADLDVLALCPSHSTRDMFFSTLVVRLNRDSRVGRLHPIPGAYTPVIKFYMDDIAIDLVFVGLVDDSKLAASNDLNTIEGDGSGIITNKPNDRGRLSPQSPMVEKERVEFKLNDSMLIGLDEPSVRSLNGVRVAQHLLTLVPNLTTFRLVLRTVKAWALINGLYSNVLGFLGGINWAILVSFICMRNKKASPPKLLRIFFLTFSRWNWPKPVSLLPIIHTPPSGVMPLQVWNPNINPRDRAHIMPIITPTYPSMNSSYNVGQSQLRRLKEELSRAVQTLAHIAKYDATATSASGSSCNKNRCCWNDLLKGNDFFHSHVHYLHVTIRATNESDFRSWFGFCESRLRILIAGLESPELGVQAYPFAKFFGPDHEGGNGTDRGGGNGETNDSSIETIEASFFVALRFAYGVECVDLKHCTEEFAYKVNSWHERKDTMDVTINHVFQNQLPSFVFECHRHINKVDFEAREEDDENLVLQKEGRSGSDISAASSNHQFGMRSPPILDVIGGCTNIDSSVKQGRQLKFSASPECLSTTDANPSPSKKQRTLLQQEGQFDDADAANFSNRCGTASSSILGVIDSGAGTGFGVKGIQMISSTSAEIATKMTAQPSPLKKRRIS